MLMMHCAETQLKKYSLHALRRKRRARSAVGDALKPDTGNIDDSFMLKYTHTQNIDHARENPAQKQKTKREKRMRHGISTRARVSLSVKLYTSMYAVL